MSMLMVGTVVLGLLSSVRAAPQIDHIVLLMEENRAFDHMCGWFNGVNGLTGNEWNPVNTSNPNGQRVVVSKDSPYIGPFDPNHGTPATTEKIFGEACLHTPGCNTPTMDGFIEYAARKHPLDQARTLMSMFTPERLPIMNALATEFALFDRYFAAHPGPTWPNRLFQLMGTSSGCTETGTPEPGSVVYKGRTIFDIVEDGGKDWAFYYADAPLEAALVEKITLHPGKIHGWRKFKEDIAAGNLPYLSWVNPRWFVNISTGEGASDQHPDHDVRLGEALMKEVYEDLRASPKWNNTLFIITYDEHGGFYDHVPPPMGIPAPDDAESFPDKNFSFTRLGVRIPTLMISPWVPKGTVIGAPRPEEKPADNSEFSITSVIATVRKMLGGDSVSKPLTKRDAWSATFDGRLSEASPRTDCPMTLPEAPKSLGAEHARAEAMQPINDLQKDILGAFRAVAGRDPATHPLPTLQGDAGPWLEGLVTQVLSGDHVLSRPTQQ